MSSFAACQHATENNRLFLRRRTFFLKMVVQGPRTSCVSHVPLTTPLYTFVPVRLAKPERRRCPKQRRDNWCGTSTINGKTLRTCTSVIHLRTLASSNATQSQWPSNSPVWWTLPYTNMGYPVFLRFSKGLFYLRRCCQN